MKASAPVPILALDVPTAAAARALTDSVGEALGSVKVGLELFCAAGPDLVRDFARGGLDVFLDLKLHDIPNTVAGAVLSVSALGAGLLTLHAGGGGRMLRAARKAADGTDDPPRLLGVTVLTSHDGKELGAVWGRKVASVPDEVARLTEQALEAGMDGVVCSPAEVAGLRARFGSDILLVCPGIRRAGDAAGDQRRVTTPAEAVRAGASHLVLGRTVTAAEDPAAAFREVVREMRDTTRAAGAV